MGKPITCWYLIAFSLAVYAGISNFKDDVAIIAFVVAAVVGGLWSLGLYQSIKRGWKERDQKEGIILGITQK